MGKGGAPLDSAGGQSSGEENDAPNSAKSADLTKMDMVTLKARLHRAEMELEEKSEANTRLNLELSKCRAEIGRLKSAHRNEVRWKSRVRYVRLLRGYHAQLDTAFFWLFRAFTEFIRNPQPINNGQKPRQ